MGIIVKYDEVQLGQQEILEAINDFVLKKYGRKVREAAHLGYSSVGGGKTAYHARADLEDPEPTTPQMVNHIEVGFADGQKFRNVLPSERRP